LGKILKKALPIILGVILIGLSFIPGAQFLLKVGITLLIGGITSLIGGQKPLSLGDTLQDGSRLTLRLNPVDVRHISYGTTATGGLLVYRETYGTNNKFLSLIIAVAGHSIQSFDTFKWASEEITFDGGGAAIGKFAGVMSLFEHLGTDNQTVDTDLDANSTKWTSAHRGRGMAYVHLKLTFDRELFPQGIQNPLFIFKGRKVYDPRLDSTNGGSGPHRLADETTWEFSNNPVLCVLDYMKGIFVGGRQIAGMGIDTAHIDFANVIAEANVCDELVTLKSGGTQIRYTLDGQVDVRKTHRENLDDMLSAMAGNLVFQSGVWRQYPGTARAAIKSRDINDVLSAVQFRARKSTIEKHNSARGLYPDAASCYQPKDIPPIINNTFIAEDGGQELWLDFDLPFTSNGVRAQRILKIHLQRTRFERQLDLGFSPVALQDQAMDNINFDYPTLGINNDKYRIADWVLAFQGSENGNIGMVIRETLIEEDDSIYGWTPVTDEQNVEPPGGLQLIEKINDQRRLPPNSVSGMLVSIDPNPLTAVDAGASATINIAAHTLVMGQNSISYSGGSLTGRAFNTKFFVFADDDNNEGGSVTYFSTTDRDTVNSQEARHFIGEIVTPVDGGGDTGGGGGGGFGGGPVGEPD